MPKLQKLEARHRCRRQLYLGLRGYAEALLFLLRLLLGLRGSAEALLFLSGLLLLLLFPNFQTLISPKPLELESRNFHRI